MNPWVRGDGVEYYAYVRSLVIDGNLNFENEWQASNPSFRQSHLDPEGNVPPQQRTATGHVINLASVGPSLLWAPFFLVIHGAVRIANHFGAHLVADGFSRPYVISMALVTALYGFAGLWLSYLLARRRVEEGWALLATVGIWFASSLPVYMYFNPFWSHAHSAFSVALFLWYWDRTRRSRTRTQWIILGMLGGLMLNVYYPNGMVLLVPLLESLHKYAGDFRAKSRNLGAAGQLFISNILFLLATGIALLPTFITHQILYGRLLATGYEGLGSWNWLHPALGQVLFSSDHGLLSWTPILIPALLGLVFLQKRDRELSFCFGAAFLGFYILIAAYPTWDGISAFGGRFFVSLTPIYVVGLAATLAEVARAFRDARRAFRISCAAIVLFVAWNLGFIFQWGMHLIPPRGPISWRQMTYNQVFIVPRKALSDLENFLLRRRSLMQRIEQMDQEQLRSRSARH